jgi:hypothetical protein
MDRRCNQGRLRRAASEIIFDPQGIEDLKRALEIAWNMMLQAIIDGFRSVLPPGGKDLDGCGRPVAEGQDSLSEKMISAIQSCDFAFHG